MAILKFKNENNEWEIVESPDTIKYIEQQLSEEQKIQARKNIGALSKEDHFKIFDDEIELNQAFEPGLYLIHLNNATSKPDLSDIQLNANYAFLKVSPYDTWYDETSEATFKEGIVQELTVFGYDDSVEWIGYSCVYTRLVYEDPTTPGFFMDDGWCKVGDSRMTNVIQDVKKLNSLPSVNYYGSPSIIPSDESLFNFNLLDNDTYQISSINFDKNDSSIINIIIPYEYNGKQVSSIGNFVFYNCIYLESVILPNTIITIGSSAFDSCSNLKTIFLSNSKITTIEMYAFYGCSKLEDVSHLLTSNIVTMAERVFENTGIIKLDLTNYKKSTIPMNCFANCTNLTTVIMPKTIKTIESEAFLKCNNLTTVYYDGNEEDWNKINIDNYLSETDDVDGGGNDALKNANIIFKQEIDLSTKANSKLLTNIDLNQIFEPGVYTVDLSTCQNGPQLEYEEYTIATFIVSSDNTWDEKDFGEPISCIVSEQNRTITTVGWSVEGTFGCQYLSYIESYGGHVSSEWIKISDSRLLNNSDSDSDSTDSTTENIFKIFNSGSDFDSLDTIVENGIYSGYIYKNHNVSGLPDDFFETDNDDEFNSQYTMMVTVDKSDSEYWSVVQVLWSYSWCGNPKYYYRFCDLYTGGSNYSYNWSSWTSPSNNIDLSNYYTKTEIDTKFDDLGNIGAETIVTSITNNHLVLEHNQDARLGTLSSLTLSLPSEIVDNYKSYLCFTSASAPMLLTCDANIIWMGDDVNENGVFTPDVDTMYEVSIRKINENSDGTPVIVARTGMTNINDSINSSGSIDLSNYYTKEETDEKLDNVYTKEEVDNLLIEKANAINQLSEEKADKEFVVSIFEQLKALIEAGKTDEVIAVLDEAIFDLAVLA